MLETNSGRRRFASRRMPVGMIFITYLLSYPAWGHPGHDHFSPSGIWPSHRPTDDSAGFGARSISLASPVIDSRINSWKLADGSTGTSPSPGINSVVSGILADVNTVAYDDNHVYIRASGIPSHTVGPFGPNPSVPGDIDATYRVSRNPTQETGPRTASVFSLGPIGDPTIAGFALVSLIGPKCYGEVNTALLGEDLIVVPNDVEFFFTYTAISEPSTYAFTWIGSHRTRNRV